MSGSGRGRTQTSMPVIPAEYKPYADAQVQALVALMNALPITAFAQWNPRPIAPMSAYTEEFLNLVPQLQVPTWGLATVAGLGPTVLNQTQAIAGTGGADRQMQIAQRLAERGPVYAPPQYAQGSVYRRPSSESA